MESNNGLPFEVGQIAESKSFQPGFRGAWFRCKIKDSRIIKGKLHYSLEFFDFPGEKVTWTQLYQKGKRRGEKSYLMLRPPFPYVYRASQMSDNCKTSQVIVIVNNEYKVGDLVDWWSDGCYWSGKITHLLNQEKVTIKLLDPPAGEGKIYEAFYKDLRPSLDWSLKRGWTLPVSLVPCARLVHPANQEIENPKPKPMPEPKTMPERKPMPEPEPEQEPKTMTEPEPKTMPKTKPKTMPEPKPSLSDSVSRTEASTTEILGKKKIQVRECDYIDSDTIESSILDLEELVSKIKWIRRGHQFGFDYASGMTPAWQFLES